MTLYRLLAESHPALMAGRVQCLQCGRALRVDSATCLRTGWPRCCGATMRLRPAALGRGTLKG